LPKGVIDQVQSLQQVSHVSHALFQDGALVVRRVASEGPGDNAGIRRGDRITAIDDAPVHELAEFYRTLWGRGAAGITVRLSLLRQGEQHEVPIKTIDRYRYLKLETTY